MRKMKKICILIVVFVCSAPMFGCTSLIFQPDKNLYVLPYQQDMRYTDIEIRDEGHPTLHGWYLSTDQNKKGTILFLHGNAQNISTHTQFVYWLPKYGYDLYVIDYRGYGRSGGVVDLGGAIVDVQRAIAHIARHSGGDIIVLGHSLGGALAVPAVSDMNSPPVKALIIASAFSDQRKIVREFLSRNSFLKLFSWPLSLTIDGSYSPLKWIGKIDAIPIYILYSDDDGVIPPEHSLALYSAANEPKFVQRLEGDHNIFLVSDRNRSVLLGILEHL